MVHLGGELNEINKYRSRLDIWKRIQSSIEELEGGKNRRKSAINKIKMSVSFEYFVEERFPCCCEMYAYEMSI